MARAIGVSFALMAALYICVTAGGDPVAGMEFDGQIVHDGSISSSVDTFQYRSTACEVAEPIESEGRSGFEIPTLRPGNMSFEIHNKCPFTVWPVVGFDEGKRLDSGQWWTVQFNGPFGIRIWGRTGCYLGKCITGMYPNATVARFTHLVRSDTHGDVLDRYEISLVDGFNLPISIIPSDSQCKPITCSSNITANCPKELTVTGGCMSACTIFYSSQYCCTEDYSNNCSPSSYSRFFEKQCPQAHSYAQDDPSKTVACPPGTNYTVVFCGDDTSAPSPAPLATSVTERSGIESE